MESLLCVQLRRMALFYDLLRPVFKTADETPPQQSAIEQRWCDKKPLLVLPCFRRVDPAL
jgi:hypothetical protein